MHTITTRFLLTLAFFAISARAFAIEPREIARKIFPSTVLIVVQDANSQPLALGSGFIVGDGKIVSNMHVVEGGSGGYVKLIGKEGKHQIKGVLAKNEELDLVLLSVTDLPTNAVTLASSGLEIGDTVFACGNPKGLEGTFSSGIVSSFRDAGSNQLLQITAPISPGSSGGPIVNANGDVIGVAVATYRGGQNLNFAIPAKFVEQLLNSPQELQEMAKGAKTDSTRTLLSKLGSERDTSGVTGDQFLWEGDISGSLANYGTFTFALKNRTKQTLKQIRGLAIIYGRDGSPADFTEFRFYGSLPPGLVRRCSGSFAASVKALTTSPSSQNQYMYSLTPSTRVEFRVLSFEIEE
jgi:S1-C subfamily serine protease